MSYSKKKVQFDSFYNPNRSSLMTQKKFKTSLCVSDSNFGYDLRSALGKLDRFETTRSPGSSVFRVDSVLKRQ